MRRTHLIGMACLSSLVAAVASADAPLRLNELRIEQPGADLDEYIELAGAAGESLNDVSIIVIGDDDFALPGQQSGTIEMVVSLAGQSVASSGFFVVGEPTLSLATPNLATSLNLEGGDNLTVLVVRGFTGSLGQDLDTNNDGVLDATPWTSVVSSLAVVATPSPDGINSEYFYSTTTIGPDAGLQPSAAWLCANTSQWNLGTVDPFAGVDSPGAANQTCVPQGIIINEIRVDETGTDNNEYFELKGGAGASLNDLTYIVLGDGSSGTSPSGFIEVAVPLTGRVIGANGLFVAAETTMTIGVPSYAVANLLNFENTDVVTHLLVRNFTGALNTDLDTNDDGVLDSTPWSEVLDSVAFVNPAATGVQEKAYSATQVGPDGTFFPGHILRCSPSQTWQIGPFNPAGGADTVNNPNAACTTCGPGGGNCHAVHATPGCVDAVCCNAVCVVDPTCCSDTWDQACVDQARTSCLVAGAAPVVALNEIRIDEPGNTDPNEYIELTGAPGTSLNGVSIVVVGDAADQNGVVEAVISLNGTTMPKDGIMLIAESTFTLGVPDAVRALNFENGDSVTYFVVFNFTGLINTDYDLNNDCTLDAQPWDQTIDSLGIKAGDNRCVYATTTAGPDYFGLPSHVVKCADGSWGNGRLDPAATNGFGTPGTANTVCPPAYACNQPKGPSCYTAHAAPGCSDSACCIAVCQIDVTCCDVTWDAACAQAATLQCFVPTNPPAVTMSEIRIDQTGFDTDEYIEIAGEPGTLLNGLTYIVIGDGSATQGSGVIEFVLPLQGQVIPADGFFLAARSTLTIGGAVPDMLLPANPEFENSDNVTHMLVFGFTGAINQDLDTNDDGTLDVSPWGALVQSVAFLESAVIPPLNTEYAYGDFRVGPDANGFVPSQLAYCPASQIWTIGPFDFVTTPGFDSPGLANPGCNYSNPCPTDLNADGVTNAADLAVLLGAWGSPGGDLNADGTTNASDLAILLGGWGPCQ
ncbi:MAG: hypothetical protein ACKOYN_03140 [Planctomycetota bacterium]